MDFAAWFVNVVRHGLGFAIHRYYSLYRALVVDNKDPLQLGRIKILCTQVHHTKSPEVWVLPSLPGGGNKRGMFFIPEENDTVWVSFFEGDPNRPEVYFGGWYGQSDGSTSDVPDTLHPTDDAKLPEKKGWTTRAGHSLIFNDEAGKESVTIIWNRPKSDDPSVQDRDQTAKTNSEENGVLTFDKNGTFTVKTPSSHIFTMDEVNKTLSLIQNLGDGPGNNLHFAENGNISLTHKSGSNVLIDDSSVTLTASVTSGMNVNISGANVSLNGGGVNLGGQALDFAVLGLRLITWLTAHFHGCGVGPTTPPLLPLTPQMILSNTVKVQQ